MSKIKICGIKRREDIEYINKYRPDYIGFIFAKSKRKIPDETARELKKELDKGIRAVGVFVNEPLSHIISLYEDNIIDLIQLHGEEGEDYIKTLRKEVPKAVIKAVRVQSREQITEAEALPVDYLLLDTYDKQQYGGSGTTFNWKMIPEIKKPYFLAGGLTIHNVAKAVTDYRPYCVDISSGVETDGVKDEEKIKEIIHLVRSL